MNMRGFTIPELLIASAMTLISIGGVVSFSSIWKRNYDTSYATYMSVALESAVLTAMVSPETYAPIKEALGDADANQKLPIPKITLNLSGVKAVDLPIQTGEPIFFNREFEPCAGFDSPTCLTRLEVRSARDATNNIAFAYTLQVNPRITVPSRSTLAKDPGTLDEWANPNSYTVPIPNVLYKKTESAACLESAIAIRSVNRDTGAVTCINKTSAASACPKGTLPTGLKLNADSNEIGFTCTGKTKIPDCTDNYSIASFSPLKAMQGVAKGKCVPATAKDSVGPKGQLTYGSSGNKKISGEVCPPNYKATSTCEVVTERNDKGYCSRTCTKASITAGVPDLNPDGTPKMINYDCSFWKDAVAGVVVIENAQRFSTCTYTDQPQPCDEPDPSKKAEFVGYPKLKVKCISILNESLSAE